MSTSATFYPVETIEDLRADWFEPAIFGQYMDFGDDYFSDYAAHVRYVLQDYAGQQITDAIVNAVERRLSRNAWMARYETGGWYWHEEDLDAEWNGIKFQDYSQTLAAEVVASLRAWVGYYLKADID